MTSVLPIPTPTPGEATVDAWADKITQLAEEMGGDGAKVATKLGEYINARDHGVVAVGPALDVSAAFQTLVNDAIADGNKAIFLPRSYLPDAYYNIDTTGITIASDGFVLFSDAGAPWEADEGAVIGYSGDDVAVTYGAAGTLLRGMQFNNIQIRAVGNAVTSATATGMKLINAIGFRSDNPSIRDFNEGIGLLFEPAGPGVVYGATNLFVNPYFVHNKIGVRSAGTDATIKDNHSRFVHGAVIGLEGSPAGSIGFDLWEHSAGYFIDSTDVEAFDVGVKSAGGNHKLYPRTETCNTHIWLTATATNNDIDEFDPNGPGVHVQNDAPLHANPKVIGRAGRVVFQPSTDGANAVLWLSADGTVRMSYSTDGTPRFEMPNGTRFEWFSDAGFANSTVVVNGATGEISGKILKAKPVATASLPAAGAAQNGRILVEDAGAGDRNLIIYAGGQRFRIDGGAAF